jgi:hypothetical protein
MSKIDTALLIDLMHCIQRAEALIQVLGESAIQKGDNHYVIQIEIIEEYLLRAKKTLNAT